MQGLYPFCISTNKGSARWYGPEYGNSTLCPPFVFFWRITLPLLWPGIMAGAMLAFVISLDDVTITEVVKTVGQDTLPTYMFGQLRRVITLEINAISLVLLAVSLVVVSVFFLFTRKRY